ncbi:MAG TPA: zf-HC2 domain-containing protein [Terriglobales bacterium]|nr:zf-HC2 domain-containing protein [Terriglobales bacterium]
MDHSEAIDLMAAEKYLLGELTPESREQFEEHFFDCQECALEVRTGAAFVEHSKVVLSEPVAISPMKVPGPAPANSGWFGWLRAAFVVPVLAALLAVIGYQNLVTYPQLKQAANSPQILPWASINISTRGTSTTQISPHVGEGFHLLVNIPPESGYTSYTFDLSSPSGRLEWSRTIPAASSDEARSIYVPGGNQEQGVYTLAVRGSMATGESSDLGRYSIAVQIQK